MRVRSFPAALALMAGLLSAVAAVGQPAGWPRVAANEPVSVWVTTGNQSMVLQPVSNLTFAAGTTGGTSAVVVDESQVFQTVEGYGAALSGSSAYLINRLPAAQRDALLTELYGPNGMRFGLVRHTMGASDFSAQGDFTYDDVPAGQTDPTLAGFNLTNDQTDLIPVLQAARQKNPALKIFGTPWTAPAWMKEQPTLHGSWLDVAHYRVYARYFERYVQAYAALGLPIYAVTLQNEPLNGFASYPSMRMDPGNQATFLKNDLGPVFRAAGFATKILVYDHNWDRPDYPNDIYRDPAANFYADGAAFHCYGGSVDQQSVTRNAYPGKEVWFTECSGTVGSSFGPDLRYNVSNIVIGAARHWAKGAILWNMALDQNNGPRNGGCTDCRGVLTINTATGAVTRNVEYYALGHASKFVDPGAVRIGSGSVAGGIETVAFRNPDSTRVLIALNNSSSARTFRIEWRGQAAVHTLTAGSVATYKWRPAGVVGTVAPIPAAARLHVYPGPESQTLVLEYDSPTPQTLRAELLDATGRTVRVVAEISAQPGANRHPLSTAGLRGAYVVRLHTADGVLHRRVVVAD